LSIFFLENDNQPKAILSRDTQCPIFFFSLVSDLQFETS